MSQKSKPRTPQKSSYRGFEGINLKKTHSGDESIAFIKNFRILDDGSLQKRCGFQSVYKSSNNHPNITASHSIIENGVEVCYFIESSYVRKYNSSTQEISDIGEFSTPTDNAFFFEYLDKLFVCNGSHILAIENSSITEPYFYIPLYGKDWHAFAGEINEVPNLLWNKVAISYKLPSPATSYLSIGKLKLQSIDAVYRNGELLAEGTYSFNERYNSISVPEFAENDTFLAIITFDGDEYYKKQREALTHSCATSVFYELNKNNLFFWGANTTNKVFYSTSLNEENAKITNLHPKNGTFYVPLDSFFTVASEKDRIRAFIRHYDRVLIMTDSSTWITNLQDLENGSLKIRNINNSIGCIVKNGCVRIENTLFSVGKDAIYAWTTDTDELNECNAHSISDPIADLLDQNFFANCSVHLNYDMREIWFYNSMRDTVWIYNYKQKLWYSYGEFTPSVILDGGAYARFFEGVLLCVFNPSLSADIRNNTITQITATLKSGELEFNTKQKKKLSSTTVRGKINGGSIKLQVTLDGKKTLIYDVSPSNSHSVIPFRTRSGSFSSMCFELTATGKGEQIIHGIELEAD